MTKQNFIKIASLISIAFVIAGCSSGTQRTEAIPDTGMGIEEVVKTEANIAPTPTPIPEPTPIPNTPTPDLRTPPTEWQDWPIVPELTNRAREIYQAGRENGVNDHAFSKVGDCQNVSDAFLGIYDKPGRYILGPNEAGWQTTIDNFNGYFNRDGASFGQGLNVAAALSPFHADQEICLPTEGPLQCELRIVNPAFSFVSFERWWSKETPPEVYEQYLRVILDNIIANGTVPILVTKADNIEGGHKINQIIANLAFEYDIPLYNWWAAAQFLDHRGMDVERYGNDGFHISYEAWDNRTYYALKTLDKLWKELNQ